MAKSPRRAGLWFWAEPALPVSRKELAAGCVSSPTRRCLDSASFRVARARHSEPCPPAGTSRGALTAHPPVRPDEDELLLVYSLTSGLFPLLGCCREPKPLGLFTRESVTDACLPLLETAERLTGSWGRSVPGADSPQEPRTCPAAPCVWSGHTLAGDRGCHRLPRDVPRACRPFVRLMSPSVCFSPSPVLVGLSLEAPGTEAGPKSPVRARGVRSPKRSGSGEARFMGTSCLLSLQVHSVSSVVSVLLNSFCEVSQEFYCIFKIENFLLPLFKKIFWCFTVNLFSFLPSAALRPGEHSDRSL